MYCHARLSDVVGEQPRVRVIPRTTLVHNLYLTTLTALTRCNTEGGWERAVRRGCWAASFGWSPPSNVSRWRWHLMQRTLDWCSSCPRRMPLLFWRPTLGQRASALYSIVDTQAFVAEWLRRLTRNQISSWSVRLNPTGCDSPISYIKAGAIAEGYLVLWFWSKNAQPFSLRLWSSSYYGNPAEQVSWTTGEELLWEE